MRLLDQCPSCGCREYTRLRKETFGYTRKPRTFLHEEVNAYLDVCRSRRLVCEIVLCRRCRLAFRAPAFDDDELKTVNSRDFSAGQRAAWFKYSHSTEEGALRDRSANSRALFGYLAGEVDILRRVAGSSAGGRIVDVGGGDGSYLYPFLEVGMDCSCVDVQAEGGCRGGVTYIASSLESFVSAVGFDCVLLIHCLEHVPWPARFLERVRNILLDNAVVLVEVPLELPFIALGLAHSHPPHLTYFTNSAMYNVLLLSGFRVLDVRTCVNGFGVAVVRAIGRKEIGRGGGARRLRKAPLAQDCFFTRAFVSSLVKRGAHRAIGGAGG